MHPSRQFGIEMDDTRSTTRLLITTVFAFICLSCKEIFIHYIHATTP